MKILIKESQFESLFPDKKLEKQINFISKSKKIHKNDNGEPLYDYSLVDYDGSQNKVKVICPKHKNEWKKETGNEYFEITPNHHLNDRGCKYCYLENKIKYTDKDIEDSAKKYKTSIEFKKQDFPRYNAARKRGNEFYKKISSHFISAKESYGETLITNILVENGLISSDCLGNSSCDNREKVFEDCTNQKIGKLCRSLRFDFYIPEENTLIEFDGEQHFSKRGKYGEKFETLKVHDIIKNEYCKTNGIKLIRIHYKVPTNKVEEELFKSLLSPEQEIFIGPY